MSVKKKNTKNSNSHWQGNDERHTNDPLFAYIVLIENSLLFHNDQIYYNANAKLSHITEYYIIQSLLDN